MFKRIDSLHFWCNKILPLVYDDSLSYYEILCKVVKYINELIDQDKVFVDELSTISNIVYNYIDTSNSKSHNFKSPLPFTTKLSLFVWNKGLWSGSNDSS